jgi:hypothetical protein
MAEPASFTRAFDAYDLNVLTCLNGLNGFFSYLNSGITRSANSRMFFSAISCGMPPK